MFKRKRDVEEGPQPSQACSYCGKDATPEYGGDGRIRGGPWQFLVQPLPTRWSRHDFLSYNGGVWWMRALGPGEWWRRCHWWSELHVAGEEKDWSILLQRCARCGVDETLMAEACSTMADDRAEWERAHPADEEAKVCGICSYCGELIKVSSTGLRSVRSVFEAVRTAYLLLRSVVDVCPRRPLETLPLVERGGCGHPRW